jgi:hypothetical protein
METSGSNVSCTLVAYLILIMRHDYFIDVSQRKKKGKGKYLASIATKPDGRSSSLMVNRCLY